MCSDRQRACRIASSLQIDVPDALENGHLAGAGIDVWENEPVSDSPIHKFENAVITPHPVSYTHLDVYKRQR